MFNFKYEQRQQSKDKEINLDLLLKKIKSEIDKLIEETTEANDCKLLLEIYDKSALKLKELAEKAFIKGIKSISFWN